MAFDRNTLVQDVIRELGQAGAGVAQSEIEEVVYNLVGDGITSFPKAAAFLAKFPGFSRRVGAVALLNILKVRPDIFGAENAPYVNALNEVIESFAEGVGRAVADVEFTEGAGREMATKVASVVRVHEGVAHRGDGKCHKRQTLVIKWTNEHPPVTRRVGTGKDARSVTTPGEPFPDMLLPLAEAIEQDATPCPVCLKQYIRGPQWARPAEPPKPKPFEDTLSPKERWVFGCLVERATDERGLARGLVRQAFEEEAWGKVRLLPDILRQGRQGKKPSDDLYQRFVRQVDAVFNPRLTDRLWGWLETAGTKASRWAAGRDWRTAGLAAAVVVALILLVVVVAAALYLAFAGLAAKLFFVDGWYHGRFWHWMIGSVLLAFAMILLVPLQRFVDWVMDQFRIIGQRLGFNVSPATTSAPWLRNLGFSAFFFLLFWGAVGLVTVGLAGGIEARAIIVIGAMLSTAAMAGYAQLYRMDLWEKGFLRTVGLVGVVPAFAITAAVMTSVEWSWKPMQAAAVQGKTNEFVVVYPNPYGQQQEYRLEDVFGSAATKHRMVWVGGDSRVYSKVRLVADLPGALEVRPREDGFGRYVYDLKPDRFPEELDLVKARAEQAKELAKVVEDVKKAKTSVWPPTTWHGLPLWLWALLTAAASVGFATLALSLQGEGIRRAIRVASGLMAGICVLWLLILGCHWIHRAIWPEPQPVVPVAQQTAATAPAVVETVLSPAPKAAPKPKKVRERGGPVTAKKDTLPQTTPPPSVLSVSEVEAAYNDRVYGAVRRTRQCIAEGRCGERKMR